MADKDKEKEKKTDKTDASPAQAGAKTGMLMWIIVLTVIIAMAGSGFVLGRLLAGSSSSEAAPAAPESEPKEKPAHGEKKPQKKASHSASESATPIEGPWYYNDLESVMVNPAEPGATRFIRVGLILEVDEVPNQEEIKGLIDSKKPLLVNYLNLYFKNLTLSEVEKEKDLNRLLVQICDAFNEIIFPGAKPLIKKILIREFNIQ